MSGTDPAGGRAQPASTEPPTLILIDGSSYLYRAFHAMPELNTRDGVPTGAILGVLNMVFKLLDADQPERMAVVFDAPGKTFRDDLLAEYKANRPPMPDPMRQQIEPLIEALGTSGIPVLRVPGVEADDVIGTLTRRGRECGFNVVISTGDKDMAQLVDEHVTLTNTMNQTSLDANGVHEKFGVHPEQIIDYLSLAGDSVDNVPGVKGVGTKTAAKWLDQYGSLANLVAHAGEIRGKVGERFREALGDLELYTRLVTIDCEVELELGPDELVVQPPDEAALTQSLERLELLSLLKRRLAKSNSAYTPPAESSEDIVRDYELVSTKPALDRWLEKVESANMAAFGFQTRGDHYLDCAAIGIGLAVGSGQAAYIPFAHEGPDAAGQLDRELVLKTLKPWLESNQPKVGQHVKLELHILANCGIQLGGTLYDALLESYVLDSTATRHELGPVATRYLGLATTPIEDVCGKGARKIGFDQLSLESARDYAAEQADTSWRLHQTLWPKLTAIPSLESVYASMEEPLLRVLQGMERQGVLVDADQLHRQSDELARSISQTEEAAYAAAGGPFGLASPKQLREVLFERLGLPVLGKTPKGQPSTAESVLNELAESYELPKLVLEYRALAKLKSTYTDKLPREIKASTGRIHTCYQQAVAATGRLSSTDPNLQNIPVRTREGRRIRQAFVAPEGSVLIAADYSQIELRIMAHLSGDERLTAAFSTGQDIHLATAAEVLDLALEDVTDEQRRSAKAVNFGLIYGMSAFGLARQLGIERHEAQQYIDLYFERYPGVRQYMDSTRAQAREQGYVSTVFGRRLYLPGIKARNSQERQYAERSAINAPMQGTAADIIKRAMLDVDAWLQSSGAQARLIMQVHDELVLEVDTRQADQVSDEVVTRMEAAAELAVPLKVDVGRGDNWDEAH